LGGSFSTYGERRGAYIVLVGDPEGNRPLGRTRFRRGDNIKIELQEGERGAWTGLRWLRVVTGGGKLRMW